MRLPLFAWSTWVHRDPTACPEPEIFLTDTVLGHQRGRFFGLVAYSHTPSGADWIALVRLTRGKLSALAGNPAQVLDQEQVLEVTRNRREILEIVDRLSSACGIMRSKRWSDQLLEQTGLTVR